MRRISTYQRHPAHPLPRALTLALCKRLCACADELRLRRWKRVVRERYVDRGMRNAVLVTIALRGRELREAVR